jgi:hypothetical protein
MSEGMSQYLVAIFNASSLLGRLVAGVISAKLGRWGVIIVFCGLSGILEFAVWIPVPLPP